MVINFINLNQEVVLDGNDPIGLFLDYPRGLGLFGQLFLKQFSKLFYIIYFCKFACFLIIIFENEDFH